MTFRQFVLLVAKMRTAQIKYFTDRGRLDLNAAKRLEAEVDTLIGRFGAEMAEIETQQHLRMALGQSEEP